MNKVPLKQSSSKKAFESNLKKEMDAGKPKAQSLAVAYSVQKRNKPKKKMADGGSVKDASNKKTVGEIIGYPGASPSPSPSPVKKAMGGEIRAASRRPTIDNSMDPREMRMRKRMSEGGIVDDDMPREYSEERTDNPISRRMLEGAPEQHSQELTAASMRPSLDADGDEHSEDMLEGAPTSGAQELDFVNEKHSNIDSEMDRRSQAMRMDQAYEHGGEIGWADHRADVDNEDADRSEEMLDDQSLSHSQEKRAGTQRASADDSLGMMDSLFHFPRMSDGGPVGPAEAIRERAKRKRFADGGMVDLSENADEDLNNEDQMSFDAARKENYSESEGLEQLDSPMDSNLHGHDLSDEDEHERSMIDEIRRSMKSRRR